MLPTHQVSENPQALRPLLAEAFLELAEAEERAQRAGAERDSAAEAAEEAQAAAEAARADERAKAEELASLKSEARPKNDLEPFLTTQPPLPPARAEQCGQLTSTHTSIHRQLLVQHQSSQPLTASPHFRAVSLPFAYLLDCLLILSPFCPRFPLLPPSAGGQSEGAAPECPLFQCGPTRRGADIRGGVRPGADTPPGAQRALPPRFRRPHWQGRWQHFSPQCAPAHLVAVSERASVIHVNSALRSSFLLSLSLSSTCLRDWSDGAQKAQEALAREATEARAQLSTVRRSISSLGACAEAPLPPATASGTGTGSEGNGEQRDAVSGGAGERPPAAARDGDGDSQSGGGGSVLDAFAQGGDASARSAVAAAAMAAFPSLRAIFDREQRDDDGSDAQSDAQFSVAPSADGSVQSGQLGPAQAAARREARVAAAQRGARNQMKFEALKQERNALRAQVRAVRAELEAVRADAARTGAVRSQLRELQEALFL